LVVSLIGDDDLPPHPNLHCYQMDPFFFLQGGIPKVRQPSSISVSLKICKNVWGLPPGYCSLLEAAHVLTNASSMDSLLLYYGSFLVRVYDLVNINSLPAMVRRTNANAE
jgi:hypothetical protein